mgnify:CR=1 FL=1
MARIIKTPRLNQLDPEQLGQAANLAFVGHLAALGIGGDDVLDRARQLAAEVASLVGLAQLGGPVARHWIAPLWPLLACPIGTVQPLEADPDRMEPSLKAELSLVVLAVQAREALALGRLLEAPQLAALASVSARTVRNNFGAFIKGERARPWLEGLGVPL